MIIKTPEGNYRPGEDDEKDEEIRFSQYAIYIVGAETRGSMSEILKDD